MEEVEEGLGRNNAKKKVVGGGGGQSTTGTSFRYKRNA